MNQLNKPLPKHFCQTKAWADCKKNMGTMVLPINDIVMTIHPLPFGIGKIGYIPRPRYEDIDFLKLRTVATEMGIISIQFDVPNDTLDSNKNWDKNSLKKCKSIFAQSTIILDTSKPINELLSNMHSKTRYNIKVAIKHGVQIRDEENIDNFYLLLAQTASRQKYYIHPKPYYSKIFETLSPKNKCLIKTAFYNDEPVSSFFLFVTDDCLYYPYGGTLSKHRETMHSTLLMWECIKYASEKNIPFFDMWGATESENTNDPWYGFTRFKKGFGGELITFPQSRVMIIDKNKYALYETSNKFRWIVLRGIKNLLTR